MRTLAFIATVLLLQACTTTYQRSRSATVEKPADATVEKNAAADATPKAEPKAAPAAAAPAMSELAEQVAERERAFAATMAKRDLRAFRSFLSKDAVFFSGPEPLRGPKAVTEWWSRYFESEKAPFSWEPGQVEVLESGTLALSTGPVRDPAGKVIGTFNSVWRLEEPGVWRIVFDKGEKVCD